MAKVAVAPTRVPARITDLNRRADHFESLIEAGFPRAMRELQRTLTKKELRLVKVKGRRVLNPLVLKRIEAVLSKHMKDIIQRTLLRGGDLGQVIVNKEL